MKEPIKGFCESPLPFLHSLAINAFTIRPGFFPWLSSECASKGSFDRANSLATAFLIAGLLCGLLTPYASYSAVFAIDVDLSFYRVPSTTPENTYKITFYTSANRQEWRVDYRDRPAKFAATFQDFVIESPSHTGQAEWRIVSSLAKGVPIDLDAEQRLTWFAYAGAKMLNTQGTPFPVPFGDARLDAYVHGCRVFAITDSSSILPSRFEFRFDEELLRKNVQELAWLDDPDYLDSRRKSFEQFIAGHKDGAIVASLVVSGYEMLEATPIPGSWEFVLNWYGSPAFHCTGLVSNARVVQAMPPVTIPNIVRITDKRVRSTTLPVDKISYMLTNASRIPDLREDIVQKAVERSTPANPTLFSRMPMDSRSPRWFIIALICSVSSLPLLIWIGLKIRNTKSGRKL